MNTRKLKFSRRDAGADSQKHLEELVSMESIYCNISDKMFNSLNKFLQDYLECDVMEMTQ